MKIVRSYQKVLITIVLHSLLLISCNQDKIPTISIYKLKPVIWAAKEQCDISISDIKDTLSAKVKLRGGMSSRYDKHSYTIEFDSAISISGLPKNDDWILNANYIDKTFIRHKLNYDLFRAMNSNNIAPKCAYSNLNLNNQPKGLYLIMEKINASMIGLDKTDSLSMLFKDPPIFYQKKPEYISDFLNIYEQKFPDINIINQSNYLEGFKNFITLSNDSTFAAQLSNWIDLKNIIDWHLLLLLSNNSDGVLKNFYLYKVNASTPFRIAIWDYDHSFGRDGDNELNMMTRTIDCNKSILLEKLNKNELLNYEQLLSERWMELRGNKTFSIEYINNQIDKNLQLIGSNAETNFEKWPIDSKWYYDNNTFEQEVQIIRNFALIRFSQLDKRFNYN